MIAKSTKASGALVNYDHMEGREGFEPSTPGLKVRGVFGPHPARFAESEGRVRWRSARTNPAVLPAWHLTTGLYALPGVTSRWELPQPAPPGVPAACCQQQRPDCGESGESQGAGGR